MAPARARELAPWEGGGGASFVLEDLGADATATVTRAEFGMCAGHGVRSPTSSKVQEAGQSHGLGRGVRPLRSLRGCRASPWRAGHAGAVAAPDIDTFQNSNGLGPKLGEPLLGEPILKLSNRSNTKTTRLGARCKHTTRI